jgi:hypothetical protein
MSYDETGAIKQAVEVIQKQAKLVDQMLTTLQTQRILIERLTARVDKLEQELTTKNEQIIKLGTQLSHYLEAGESST